MGTLADHDSGALMQSLTIYKTALRMGSKAAATPH